MRVRRPVVAVAITGALLGATVPAAWAAFLDTGSGAASFSTTTLRSPTDLAAQRTCHTVLLDLVSTLTMDVTLTWTASPDDWAGHEVLEQVTDAWVVRATLEPGAPSTWTATGLSNEARTWQVRSVKGGWTALSPSSVTTDACPLL